MKHFCRAATVLRDARYIIEAHFEMTEKANASDNPGKFQDIITRRIEKGRRYYTPYFGCREFSVNFRRWKGGEIPAVNLTRDLGLMLYDMDYTDPEKPAPNFFLAKIENGVIDLKDCEALK